MEHRQNHNPPFFSATVVRKLSTGKVSFHKYRTVSGKAAPLERFQRTMFMLPNIDGDVTHINYYDKDSKRFHHQWKPEY